MSNNRGHRNGNRHWTMEKPESMPAKTWESVCALAAKLMLESGGEIPVRTALSEAQRMRRAAA